MLFKILLVVAAVWLALAVIGLIAKVAFWLIVIGVVLFVVTALLGGWSKRQSRTDV